MRQQVYQENIDLQETSEISHTHETDHVSELAEPDNVVTTQEAPDGGKRAWLGVFGSFMIFVNIWGFTFTFGTFQSYYTLTLLSKESPSSISWIGTIQSFLLIVGGVMTGPFYDKGAYRTMMLSGMCLVLLGVFMLSLSREYYQIFLTQGVCVGIGGALLYVPTLALVSSSFRRKRALATGVVTCGVGLGGVIYVAAFQQLLPKLGFAWTVRVLAFMALGIFLLSIPSLIFRSPASTSTTPNVPTTRTKRKLFDVNALKNRGFQVYSAASFFLFLGYLVPFFYIPSYAQIALGTSTATGFWALATSSATSIAGRLILSFVAQRVGVMAPLASCTTVSGILCLCWIRVASTPSFFVFCALYGFFSGALVALPPSLFPRMCKDPSLLGTWLGMGWVCSGTAFLVGSPLAGALASVGLGGVGGGGQGQVLNFLALQLFSALTLLFGSLLLLVLWVVLFRMDDTVEDGRREGTNEKKSIWI